MQTPSWWYDEFQHFGADFADVEEVRAYDAKQGTTVEDEKTLVQALGIRANDTVIEFGCGTGAFTVAAAQQCRHVTAVDISNAMLDFTAERTASYGLSNVTYYQAGRTI
ncbi:MAG: class I SAM-dependent methyltransferase [Chloroflexota bacterium]